MAATQQATARVAAQLAALDARNRALERSARSIGNRAAESQPSALNSGSSVA
jgi:hypothetical protein